MQADQDGFLTGASIVNAGAEEEERRAESTAVGVQNIAGNVRAIRRFLEKAGPVAPSVSPSGRARAVNLAPVARVHAGDIDRIAAAARKAPTAQRGADGRFTAGSGGGRPSVAMPAARGLASGLSGAAGAAARIDPAAGALSELRDAVSPVGRGFMALHARMAERKKERWYSRILKALTGRSGQGAGAAGVADVGRSSFLGTFMGELMGNAARVLPAVLAGAGGLLLKGLGLLGAFGVGQYIGGKIYEWLDKSGIATKIFDAFDAVKGWVKDKAGKVAERVQSAQRDVAERDASRVSSNTANNWAGAKLHLEQASAQAGVDPRVVAKIAHFESKFSRHARPRRKDGSLMSSAHGYGQLLDGTWTDMLNKHGAKYGVAGAGKLSKAQAMALRDDPKLQAAMLAELTRENVERGRALGGSNDDANVYALHNLGTGDGSKFLRALKANPGAPVSSVLSPEVIRNNPSLYGRGQVSIHEAYGLMGKHMATGNRFAAEFGAVSSAGVSVAGVKPSPAMATLQAVKPQSVPPSAPERVQVVQPDKTPERVGWGREDRPVVVQKEEAGQDVRDRKLAHIVTGGIGG